MGLTLGVPSLTTTAVPSSPVTTYPIAAALGGLTSTNYTFVFGPGILTVTPSPLTVTANAASKTYGTTVAFAGTEFTTLGLLFGDTVTSVGLVGTAAGDASASVVGSPYVGDIIASAAVGTGLGKHDHVCGWNADGDTGAADSDGERGEQDVRDDGGVCRDGIRGQWVAVPR